jgi:hypothetical protein
MSGLLLVLGIPPLTVALAGLVLLVLFLLLMAWADRVERHRA